MTAEHAPRTIPLPPRATNAALFHPLGRHACDKHLLDYWLGITAEVSRIQNFIDRNIEQSGIAAQYGAVLHLLLRTDDHRMPMTVLARDLSMTSGGLTKLADRMVTAGLIARRGRPGDRRVVNAILTARGLILAQQTARTYREALRKCLFDGVAGETEPVEDVCGCAGPCSRQ